MKVVIVGAGKLGLKVANVLLGGDNDVTIIDTNEEILQKNQFSDGCNDFKCQCKRDKNS